MCFCSSRYVFSISWMDRKWWGKNFCAFAHSVFSRYGIRTSSSSNCTNNSCWVNWLCNFRTSRTLFCNLYFRSRCSCWWNFRWNWNYRSRARIYNSSISRRWKLRVERTIFLFFKLYSSCVNFCCSKISLLNSI